MAALILFFVMSAVGAAGGVLGSVLGRGIAPGGLLLGGLIGGMAAVIGAGYYATARNWIKRPQRPWTIGGAALGFASAGIVTLSTLGSPEGHVVSVLLIGTGAVLGSRIGKSAHDGLDE